MNECGRQGGKEGEGGHGDCAFEIERGTFLSFSLIYTLLSPAREVTAVLTALYLVGRNRGR